MIIFIYVNDMQIGDRGPSLQWDISRVLRPQRLSVASVSAAAAGS